MWAVGRIHMRRGLDIMCNSNGRPCHARHKFTHQAVQLSANPRCGCLGHSLNSATAEESHNEIILHWSRAQNLLKTVHNSFAERLTQKFEAL